MGSKDKMQDLLDSVDPKDQGQQEAADPRPEQETACPEPVEGEANEPAEAPSEREMEALSTLRFQHQSWNSKVRRPS